MIVAAIRAIPGFAEPFSAISHLLAAGFALISGIILIRRGRGQWTTTLSLIIFVTTCVFLLSMSGVYHLLQPDTAGREVLRRLDHAAIFALIAGTFTAIHGILFRGVWRWGMILVIWTMAITGITLKSIFFHSLPSWAGVSLYLVMGWMGLISGYGMCREYGLPVLRKPLFGGLAYTLGAELDVMGAPILIPGVLESHELFHIAVLFGLGWHWSFVADLAHRGVALSPRPFAPASHRVQVGPRRPD